MVLILFVILRIVGGKGQTGSAYDRVLPGRLEAKEIYVSRRSEG
jgi:hypothetical protein